MLSNTMEVVEGRESSSLVPESVMEAVNRTLERVEEVKALCVEFAPLADPALLAELPPLQQAQTLFLLAKASTILFALRLRCNGIDPDEHAVNSEFERLRLYQDKIDHFKSLSKAPIRPSTTLNYQAATRFIEHSLSDLTTEQRQSMRNISREEGKKNISCGEGKKRKYQSTEKKSAKTAAKEFLEKAAQELLGSNKDGFKGPLRNETSSSEEDEE